MINTFQDLTFGCLSLFVLCRMSHYIDLNITIQAVFFMKCNCGDFILHYINQNVLQLLIGKMTVVHLYRIVEKEKKTPKYFIAI